MQVILYIKKVYFFYCERSCCCIVVRYQMIILFVCVCVLQTSLLSMAVVLVVEMALLLEHITSKVTNTCTH